MHLSPKGLDEQNELPPYGPSRSLTGLIAAIVFWALAGQVDKPAKPAQLVASCRIVK